MSEHTPGQIHISKCRCGDPVCDQYTLSTQGSVGFSLADATLYAAAPALLDAAIRVIRTQDEFNTYARTAMPSRALLPEPDRDAGNKAFADLRAALALASPDEGES